jgi:hypothetical protein
MLDTGCWILDAGCWMLDDTNQFPLNIGCCRIHNIQQYYCALLTNCHSRGSGNPLKNNLLRKKHLDPCWSLPLWIPASAGMTKGAWMTFLY